MKKIVLLGLCAVAILPQYVLAGPVVRTGETISVDATQSIKGDFYGLSPSVAISGPAENDVYIAGGKVTINSSVAQDVSILGGTVQVHGEIGDDLRVIGGDVVLASPIKGDVFVIAGSLTILSTASVEGDVLFWGNTLDLEGAVMGAIHGSSDSIRINAPVKGGIEYSAAQSFVLGDKADVTGTIVHSGTADISRAAGSVVAGEIQYVSTSSQESPEGQAYMIAIISILFSTFVFYFVAPGTVRRFVEKSQSHIGMYGLIGLGVLIATPLISILLSVSVVGLAVGLFLFFGYVALCICACMFGIIAMGMIVQKVLLKRNDVIFMTPLIGAIVFVVVASIPIAGGFLLLALLSVSVGVIANSIFHTVRG